MAKDEKVVPLRRAAKCPICGRPAVREFHPFCSRRHADEDLSRWLTGKYAIRSADDERDSVAKEDGGDDES